jgi:hypothetical protein
MRRPHCVALAALIAASLTCCTTTTERPAPEPVLRPETCVLIGRFTYPWSKPELRSWLEKLGFQVRNELTPDVDTAFIGSDPVAESGDRFEPVTSRADYQAAVAQGVRIVRWQDVHREVMAALRGD